VDLVYSTEEASPLAVAAEIRSACPRVLGANSTRSNGTPLSSPAQSTSAQSSLADDQLADRWERQALGGSGVSHVDHVRVGWVLHRRHGAFEAEERLVEGTRKGCEHYGVPEKFDEQLTREWARAISEAIENAPESESFEEFIGRNPHLRRGDLYSGPRD
jgi:hypothetical protein